MRVDEGRRCDSTRDHSLVEPEEHYPGPVFRENQPCVSDDLGNNCSANTNLFRHLRRTTYHSQR